MIMKKNIFFIAVISIVMTFNSYAMTNKIDDNYFLKPASPSTEVKSGDYTKDVYWIWVKDNLCLRSTMREKTNQALLLQMWDLGFIPRWSDGNDSKTRDTYSGKWSQDANSVKSFIFDDYTIPVGPTNIDGVVYAFNGYGQLMDGYNYWGDLTTGADGLVVTDNPEFLEWLSTQYLPECTSHE